MEHSEYVDLRNYWQILKRRYLPASLAFALVAGGGIAITKATRTPTYTAEGQLLLKKKSTAVSLTATEQGTDKLEPISRESNPVVTEAAVIRSNSIIHKTIDRLNKQYGISLSAVELLQALNVTTAKKAEQLADLIQVQFDSANPEQAAIVVNALMQTYLQEHIQTRQEDISATRKFLEQKLPPAREKIEQARKALQQFKEDNQMPLLQAQGQSTVELIQGGQQRISELQSQLADTQIQAQVLRSQLGMNSQQALRATSLSQSLGVQEALKKLQDVEIQLAIQRSRHQDESPVIADLKAQEANLRQILQARTQTVSGQDLRSSQSLQIGTLQQSLTAELAKLEAKQRGLIQELDSLRTTQANYERQVNRLPGLEKQQQALEQQLQDARAEYSQILTKHSESQLAENQNAGNVRIVSEAVIPSSPTSSNTIHYLASGLLGLLAAGIVVFVLEVNGKSIKTLDRVQQRFGFTVLGVIPELQGSLPTGSLYYDLSNGFRREPAQIQIEEAYRILRANLKSLQLGKASSVIVFTSSVPQEGTSTVCANLAMAMARIGHKTLLLDVNLHDPVQHQIWKLPHDVGLNQVIQQNVDPKSVIHTVADNLDVLPTGVNLASPADLIDSGQMGMLIKTLSDSYDFVFIDAPALKIAADALVLGQMADGVLLTVKPGVVDTMSAAAAKSSLEQSNQKILGIVMNGSTLNSLPPVSSLIDPTVLVRRSQ